MRSVAIAGAGITGLTAAFYLQDSFEVDLFETRSRVGGVIESERRGGYLVEHGPNTVRGGGQALEDVVRALDLDERRIYPGDTARKRFIVKDGRPTPVPLNPFSLVTSGLLSTSAKLRLLKEPFISNSPPSPDETVSEFIERRFGREPVDYAVDPFMAGVYAGDPDRLSAAHVFEKLYAWEREHGSIVRGALFGRSNDTEKTSGRGRRIFTFPGGLETLPAALGDKLAHQPKLETSVTQITRAGEQWKITFADETGRQTASYDAVLLTIPLGQLESVEIDVAVDLSPLLRVPYPPLAIMALGFHRDQVSHPLDGFGVLVPGKEPFQILGTLFSSSLAPDRAPDDHVLLTSFVGGMRAPEQARLDAASLKKLVQTDLSNLLGIQGAPSFYHHVRRRRAIPQYVTGYQEVLDTIDMLEAQHPGLYMAGNFRGGISVGDAMESGAAAARKIAAAVGNRPPSV